MDKITNNEYILRKLIFHTFVHIIKIQFDLPMAIIKPLKGYRPQVEKAKEIASRPYDVMNVDEARVEVADKPYSFLRITRSEVELPTDIDVHDMAVYLKAKEKLEEFKKNNIFIQEREECLYIYQQTMNNHTQTGLLCLSSLADYRNNIIKKHENTRPEKELDRTNHIKITRAHTGKVFMTYKGIDEINKIIDMYITTHDPYYNFTTEDNVTHVLWVINDAEKINTLVSLFDSKVSATYIADGHHRVASANNAAQELDIDEAQYFLTVLFPADQLAIIDYNRIIKDTNGLSTELLLDKIANKFDIQKSDIPIRPYQLHVLGMYIDKQWYQLKAKDGTYTHDPIGKLDVSILQNNILSEILEIHDPRTDSRVDFVGGIRGISELEKLVDSGRASLAFSLFPVTIQQLIDIADSGNVMPPKSTWFEPKLRDGLIVYQF